MSKEPQYIAIRPEFTTVEVMGSKAKVLQYLAEHFNVEEIKSSIEVYELGARRHLVVDFAREVEPA